MNQNKYDSIRRVLRITKQILSIILTLIKILRELLNQKLKNISGTFLDLFESFRTKEGTLNPTANGSTDHPAKALIWHLP